MIDLRATSCWVGAQQHILWPVPWLLRYTCASGRNNTASLGIYIWDSGDQLEQSKYLIKRRDQLPHINPTRPESRIEHRISFIVNFFFFFTWKTVNPHSNCTNRRKIFKDVVLFQVSHVAAEKPGDVKTWITNWEEFPSSRSDLVQKCVTTAWRYLF